MNVKREAKLIDRLSQEPDKSKEDHMGNPALMNYTPRHSSSTNKASVGANKNEWRRDQSQLIASAKDRHNWHNMQCISVTPGQSIGSFPRRQPWLPQHGIEIRQVAMLCVTSTLIACFRAKDIQP
ncbi:MAG: hypothetical protein HC853_00190 [Anaerolineae bacterium]|nr:hypothetical protein [Anaerolineae bacterium]